MSEFLNKHKSMELTPEETENELLSSYRRDYELMNDEERKMFVDSLKEEIKDEQNIIAFNAAKKFLG